MIFVARKCFRGSLFASLLLLCSSSVLIANQHLESSQTIQTSLMKEAPKTLLAHFMVSFGTPQRLGNWKGWNYSNRNVKHNPNRYVGKGRRDIASVYYPTIGPYDMTDPHLVEYHCQLMKMAGIDGAIFDLGFYNHPAAATKKQADFAQRAMRLYATYFKRYNLKSVINYEEKVHWFWNKKARTRKELVQAAFQDIEKWLALFEATYLKVKNQKLVFFYNYDYAVGKKGASRLSPKEIKRWMTGYKKHEKPILLSQSYNSDYRGIMNGFFEWPTLKPTPPKKKAFSHYNDLRTETQIWSYKEKDTRNYLKYNHVNFIIGGVWPGFNDKGCYGWDKGHRLIPRYNGKMYQYHWERMIKADYPIVQIATWNDWFEGTVIEPSEEFGYQYLEMTRDYASKWKKQELQKGDFRVPEWIYKLRKSTKNNDVQKATDRASKEVMKGNYKQAKAHITPYLNVLGIARK